MAPPPTAPSSPAQIFGTSFDDTKKLLSACIAFLSDDEDEDSLFGNVDALHAAIVKDSHAHPNFWTAMETVVRQAHQAGGLDDGTYVINNVPVPVFNQVLSNLDLDLLNAERDTLWTQAGVARSARARSRSVGPPGDGAPSAAPPASTPPAAGVAPIVVAPVFGAAVTSSPLLRPRPKADDILKRLPDDSEEEEEEESDDDPGQLSGDSLGRRPLRSAPVSKEAPPVVKPKAKQPKGDSLIDNAIKTVVANSPHDYKTRPKAANKRSQPSSRSAPAAPDDDDDGGGSDSSSEDDGGFASPLASAPPLPDDTEDEDFVAALLAAPAVDSQLGVLSTPLGRQISSRARAFRLLKKSVLREFAERSNAPLPMDVREAILRNEYVDLGKVLAYNPATTYSQPLGLGDNPLLVMEAPSPSRPVTSFTDWLDVFSKVVQYTLTAYPFRRDEFNAYSEWFRLRATRTPNLLSRYLDFDANYRRHLGMLGYPDTLLEAHAQYDLLQEFVHNPQVTKSSSSHSSTTSTKRPSPEVDYCRRWNSNYEHDASGCLAIDRVHRCSRCDSADHRVVDCKKAKGGGGGGRKPGNRGGATGDAAGKSLRQ